MTTIAASVPVLRWAAQRARLDDDNLTARFPKWPLWLSGDPCTKSGVFLREITSRLNTGLADEMPDLDERVNHILTKQVFGIGITNLNRCCYGLRMLSSKTLPRTCEPKSKP